MKLMWIFLLCTVVLSGTYGQLTETELATFRSHHVTISDYDADTYLFEHVGVPTTHETGSFPNSDNPNSVTEQNHDFLIPKIPTMASPLGCLPMGTIGVAVTGIPYFNPYSALGYNAVEGEYREIFDQCSGHPQQNGAYHYHSIPACVYNSTALNQLLGVSLDGIPIYGPKDEHGNTLTSDDLDECHGRCLNGRYVYVATHDFPYIQRCYRGVTVNAATPGRKKRQTRPRPPPDGGGGGGGQNVDSCYAVCENPAEGCVEVLIAGSSYDSNTVSTSSSNTITCTSGSTTQSSNPETTTPTTLQLTTTASASIQTTTTTSSTASETTTNTAIISTTSTVQTMTPPSTSPRSSASPTRQSSPTGSSVSPGSSSTPNTSVNPATGDSTPSSTGQAPRGSGDGTILQASSANRVTAYPSVSVFISTMSVALVYSIIAQVRD